MPADLLLAPESYAKTCANRVAHLNTFSTITSTPSLELSKQLLRRWRLLSPAGVRHDVPDSDGSRECCSPGWLLIDLLLAPNGKAPPLLPRPQ